MTWLATAVKRFLCSHHYAYFRLLAVPGGQVIQVKCDLCGKKRCGRSLYPEV